MARRKRAQKKRAEVADSALIASSDGSAFAGNDPGEVEEECSRRGARSCPSARLRRVKKTSRRRRGR